MQQHLEAHALGNLGAEPDFKHLDSGVAVVNFRLLITPSKKVGEQWEDGETIALDCTAWRDVAENIAATFRKGMRVHATGMLTQRTYERSDGTKGVALQMDVKHASPSLEYATAQVMRRDRKSDQGGFQQPTQQQSEPWATAQPGQAQAAPQADVWGAPGAVYKDETPW